MATLKNLLQTDLSSSTKAELVDIIKEVKENIGSDYDEIVGITDTELPKLKKGELINVIGMLNEAYHPQWEDAFQAGSAVFKKILSKMDEADFSAADAADANFAAELGSIDFATLIGGPLNACVTAQTNASMATVDFIKGVGFDKDGKINMVDFSYKKDTGDATENVVIKIPLLSILNIPSMRIENCTIDFNVKLNSVYTKDTTENLGIDASLGIKWGPIDFKVSASYQKSTSIGTKVDKEYTMGVKVVATNDEMPAGLEKVLGMLSEAVQA